MSDLRDPQGLKSKTSLLGEPVTGNCKGVDFVVVKFTQDSSRLCLDQPSFTPWHHFSITIELPIKITPVNPQTPKGDQIPPYIIGSHS